METIRLKNIKAFEDSGEIEIKPLTIFVGENSSGKSSLVRFLPVIAQTFQEDVMTPLLFFGKWIDYGNYASVAHNSTDEDLAFEFKIKTTHILQFLFGRIKLEYLKEIYSNMKKNRETRCKVKLFKNKRKIQVKSFKIYIGNENLFTINFETNKYTIISKYFNKINGMKLFFKFNRFIPELDERGFSSLLKDFFKENNFEKFEEAFKFLDRNYYYYSSEELLLFEDSLKSDEKLIIEDAKNLREEYETISRMLRGIERYFERYSSKLTYIGPFRNDPERVYRESESTYKNVGIRGENTSFVLKQSYNDKTNLLEKVSNWLHTALGVKLTIKEVYENNLFEIKIKGKNEYEANLIDVGYGISQVLPIISELYRGQESDLEEEHFRSPRSFYETLLIEQPELHLHPKAQSNLAELFVDRIRQNKKIIVETHSEHLIRKLQVLIANPSIKFSKDDLAIYYIDKEGTGSVAKKMELNDYGQFLTPWPSGFFDKGAQLNMELLKFLMEDK